MSDLPPRKLNMTVECDIGGAIDLFVKPRRARRTGVDPSEAKKGFSLKFIEIPKESQESPEALLIQRVARAQL